MNKQIRPASLSSLTRQLQKQKMEIEGLGWKAGDTEERAIFHVPYGNALPPATKSFWVQRGKKSSFEPSLWSHQAEKNLINDST